MKTRLPAEGGFCSRQFILVFAGLVVQGQLFRSVFASAELSRATLQLGWVGKFQHFYQTASKLLTMELMLLRQGSAPQR